MTEGNATRLSLSGMALTAQLLTDYLETDDYLATLIRKISMKKTKKQFLIALGCVIHEDRVLMIQRSDSAHPDLHLKWELPGGKVEFGEDPRQSVCREVEEETGCRVERPKLLPFPYIVVRSYPTETFHAIIHAYECELTEESVSVPEIEEISDVAWFPITEIDYFTVQPGSAQFIWHVASRRGLLQDAEFTNSFHHAKFRRADSRHSKEYYVNIELRPSKERPYVMSRAWRRIGGKWSSKEEDFDTKHAFLNALAKVITLRIKHKYKVYDVSINFPLRHLLEEHVSDDRSEDEQMKLL